MLTLSHCETDTYTHSRKRNHFVAIIDTHYFALICEEIQPEYVHQNISLDVLINLFLFKKTCNMHCAFMQTKVDECPISC